MLSFVHESAARNEFPIFLGRELSIAQAFQLLSHDLQALEVLILTQLPRAIVLPLRKDLDDRGSLIASVVVGDDDIRVRIFLEYVLLFGLISLLGSRCVASRSVPWKSLISQIFVRIDESILLVYFDVIVSDAENSCLGQSLASLVDVDRIEMMEKRLGHWRRFGREHHCAAEENNLKLNVFLIYILTTLRTRLTLIIFV